MPERRTKRALLSVYDKTGLVDFARALHGEYGVELISTGGTAHVLAEAGLPVTLVESITGFPEMLDGRVKTLHPKIHAAILADRDNPDHMRQLAEQGIEPIDMVVVDLYPFEKTVADPNCTFEQAIEMIDIGGPCLLRAAAKNHRHVLVLSDSRDWPNVLTWLREPDRLSNEAWAQVRRDYAVAVFDTVSRYDACVAQWLSENHWRALHLRVLDELRYGENPHQSGWLTEHSGSATPEGAPGEPLSRWAPRPLPWADFGLNRESEVEISFNNYLDAHAALELCCELTRAGARLALSPAASEPHDSAAPPRKPVWHRPMAGDPAASASFRRPIDNETFTRRNLPHIQCPGATYFITFRTHHGAFSPDERDVVMDCCLFGDRQQHCLHAAVCMPDHVHVLLTPLESSPGHWHSLTEILHDLKGNIGRQVAARRKHAGPVLQDESFDHIIRNREDFLETLEYICTNPDRAKLTEKGAYPWLIYEEEPEWDAGQRAGAIDLQHVLRVDRQESRHWHVKLQPGGHKKQAGGAASAETMAPKLHRPLAGATPTAGAAPTADATRGIDLTPGTGTLPAGARALDCARALPAAVCFIKHTNACGAAVVGPAIESATADSAEEAIHTFRVEAYRMAYLGDPNAAMGGILAVNFDVDAAFAEVVLETYARFGKPLRAAGHPAPPGAFFVEVWLAPSFTADAVALIRGTYDPAAASPASGESRIDNPPKKDWGQRVRLLGVGDMSLPPANEPDFKKVAGGMLIQDRDNVGLNEEQWQVVTERQPTERELADLRLAWLICKHTKSNAITICRDGMLLGNGAGQMSRVMSCRVATWSAQENGHALEGAVAASDAFFPFRDGPDLLINAGVTAIIQPGGSKRDEDTIAACNERGVAMIFTGTRHFRH